MLNDRIETLIISSLMNDEKFARKVLPFIDTEYFKDATEKCIVTKIKSFIEKYNNIPTKEAILIQSREDSNLSQELFDNITEYIKDLSYDKKIDTEFLIEKAESFCQEKAVHNAILSSIRILDGKDKKLGKGSIPELLSQALSVTFDPNVGHDYLEDWEERYNFYHEDLERISLPHYSP